VEPEWNLPKKYFALPVTIKKSSWGDRLVESIKFAAALASRGAWFDLI
jgi:hypothetical protein